MIGELSGILLGSPRLSSSFENRATRDIGARDGEGQLTRPITEIEKSDRTGRAPEQPSGKFELSEGEKAALEELRQRDTEVRAHEQAHLAAAGQHARGGPRYEYQTGPDGRRYAVGGSVQLDTSAVPGDPEETIQKMQRVRAAALAPGDPSAQDQRVAAQASRKEQEARSELKKSESEETDADSASEMIADDPEQSKRVGAIPETADRQQDQYPSSPDGRLEKGRFIDVVV